MIDKNTKLEEEIKRLKEQMKPDDEVEKLTTLMAGKSRGYLRTVGGTLKNTVSKRYVKYVDWSVRKKLNTITTRKVIVLKGTGAVTSVTSKLKLDQI